jgi:hypothetical protein
MHGFSLGAGALLALQACAMDTGNGDDIGATTEALSGFWYYHTSCVGDCVDVDLGTDVNRTCVLGGITGSLQATARVRVERRADGHYWLDVYNNQSNAIKAFVTCFPTSAGRTSEYIAFGNTSVAIPGAATRRCFLTSVLTHSSAANAFDRVEDYANVWYNFLSGHWVLTNSQSASPYASAWIGATCVNLPEHVKSGYRYSGDGFTGVILDQVDEACAMTGLGGQINKNTPLYYSGVYVSYDPTDDQWFEWATPGETNASKLWYACYR